MPSAVGGGVTHAAGMTAAQWGWFALFWAATALVPAFFVRRATAREGNPAAPAWFVVVLLTGPVGVGAWWMDRRIRARRKAQGRPMPK